MEDNKELVEEPTENVEEQATDRTYRIGQKKNVQVYKLITKNSIEEKRSNAKQEIRKLKLLEKIEISRLYKNQQKLENAQKALQRNERSGQRKDHYAGYR